MIKLVIFDLDGTLLNTLEDLAIATNLVLQRHGYPIHAVEDYRYFVGNGLYNQVARAMPEESRIPELVEPLMEEELAYYNVHRTDHTRPYPGILELLQQLAQRNIAAAVVTNKPNEPAQELVREMFPNVCFSSVQGRVPGVPLKPDPVSVHRAIEIAGVKQDEVLYVGDSGVDMETACNAHVKGIGVLWGYRSKEELEQAGASALITQPQQLLDFIK